MCAALLARCKMLRSVCPFGVALAAWESDMLLLALISCCRTYMCLHWDQTDNMYRGIQGYTGPL
jgi:hypothetical protein